ncbi:MAG TPA: hypothetical protein PLG90_00015 [Ignavibacteria bacterium]|nr:hypothetical protein [Ignavibacteria bacterium]
MKIKNVLYILIMSFCLSNIANAQFINKFSVFGGFMTGSYMPKISELNKQLVQAGLPEFPASGYFAFGGGGYIDIPKTTFRVGGFGTGYSKSVSTITPANVTKKVDLEMGMGGLSIEYVQPLSKSIDLTFGTNITTGVFSMNVFQYNSQFGSYTNFWNEITNSSSSQNISQKFNQRFYSAEPKVGIGALLNSFLYVKANVGYMFSANGGWKAENGVELTGVPSDIKPDGLAIDLSLNVGLFFK